MSNNGWRITGRVIRYIAFVCVFAVIGLLIWRMLSSGDPQSVKTLMVNQKTFEAYRAEGDRLYIYSQEQNKLTRAENNYGYFGVTQVSIIPAAQQVQVVFRYNNSTLRYVAEDLGLESVPGRDETVFDVSIIVNTDLTPDITDDNAYNASEYPESVSAKRYFPSAVISERKNVYNYRKYIFDGITVDELTLAMFFDIYYNGTGDTDYSKPAYGTLCLYDYASKNIAVKLTKHDIEALEEWRD